MFNLTCLPFPCFVITNLEFCPYHTRSVLIIVIVYCPVDLVEVMRLADATNLVHGTCDLP